MCISGMRERPLNKFLTVDNMSFCALREGVPLSQILHSLYCKYCGKICLHIPVSKVKGILNETLNACWNELQRTWEEGGYSIAVYFCSH